MRIEDYFAEIQKAVDRSPIVRLSNVTYEKRGTHEGIIKGMVDFVDGTLLEWREYVDVEKEVDCLMYVYQYMDFSKQLIFRYDNSGHHKKLDIPTYPHHKHLGRDQNIVPSEPKGLTAVLQEIEGMVKLA